MRIPSKAVLSVGLVIGTAVGLSLSACTQGDDDPIEEPFDVVCSDYGLGVPDDYPSGSSASSSGWGTSSGMGGAGSTSSSSSSSTGEVAPPQGGADPGEPFECAELDESEPAVLYISNDDSNSMGSPVHARELIESGSIGGLSPETIRTYEFLNYYNIDYEPPESSAVAVVPQLEPTGEPGQYELQIGVRSPDAVEPRRPMTITFVLDTSGSMGGSPMAREQAVVRAVAQSLMFGDVVNMVTWSTSNNVVLDGHIASGPNDPLIVGLADCLSANGGTDLNRGLVEGYRLAKKHYGPNRLNRVLLVSDGGANVGITDEDLIGQHSEDADQEGIYMVGVGTGPASGYNDLLMDKVTDAGRGAYVYIDRPAEAERMFVDRFDEVMEVAARDVQVQLTMPWYMQMQKFHGEEVSEDPDEVKPQHLAPGDAMVFNQLLRACDAGMVAGSDTVKVRVTWVTPLEYAPMESWMELTFDQLLDGETAQLRKGRAIVAYAEALKTGASEDLSAAHALAMDANPGGDAELDEIAGLIAKHPAFTP